MRYYISVLLLLFMVAGCSAHSNSELTWFNSSDDAIKDGIEREGITESDILAKEEKDEDTLIIFKMNLPEGTALGVASLAKENGKYAWYRADQLVLIQHANKQMAPVTKTVINTYSKNSFSIYLGATKDLNEMIETDKGSVTPIIDPNTGLFYYIE